MENPGGLGAFLCGETWGNQVDTCWLVRGAHPLWEGAYGTSHLESSTILFQIHLPAAKAGDFLVLFFWVFFGGVCFWVWVFFFCVHIGVG